MGYSPNRLAAALSETESTCGTSPRTHTEEVYDLYMAELDMKSVKRALRDWEHFCNRVRPHHSLDLLSPAEYLYKHHQGLVPISKPSHSAEGIHKLDHQFVTMLEC